MLRIAVQAKGRLFDETMSFLEESDGKHLHQQQSHEEIGQGVADEAAESQEIVREPVMAHGGQDAQRHRQQHRGRHGQALFRVAHLSGSRERPALPGKF